TTAGAKTGTVTISSNATSGGTSTISLSGTGQASATLSALSCSSSSLTGAGTDACTVTLTSAASGATAVSLTSSSSAVKVPASVTIASGATSASFTATVTAVSSNQTATLTATAAGVSKTFALTLNAATPTLTLGASNVSFGTVNLNTPATQAITMTSSGTSAVTVSAATVTGSGFTLPGAKFPMTLNPGQAATLEVQFDPTTAGAQTGSVSLASNCSMGGTMAVALTGTGEAAATYEVQLNWDAPASSSDPIAGYHVYRATGGGSYALLSSSVNIPTTYNDTTAQAGATYNYEVTSVDASGVESIPSNVYTATIP
ncbi:MAG TPA: choice-of-anchor D domain-containing protein, partial [Acidobacteriaceae bacterium]